MASYATLADVQHQVDTAELIQLTDDVDSGEVDAALVASHLETASVEIDGYLGARYALPLDAPPPILAKFCVDILVFNLYARRQGAPEHWAARYNNAIKFLVNVAAGKIGLGVDDPAGNANSAAPQVTGPARIFSRDKLSGF